MLNDALVIGKPKNNTALIIVLSIIGVFAAIVIITISVICYKRANH